ncbi:MAG: DUF4190 domain-containing protein [Mycobacterium sp.]|nr:DUF4190 domain-containing protein [Mycobacterium sp.]
MTVPGGDSGEKAPDEPKHLPPTVGAHSQRVTESPSSRGLPPPVWEAQTPVQPEPNSPRDSPDSPLPGSVPPSNPPTFGYPPPAYPPLGYPPSTPPPACDGPPGYQNATGYGDPPYPPVYGHPRPGEYRPPGYPGTSAEQPETNTLAIVSLVASLVGLLCLVGSIVGIVFGAVAANQIKHTREPGYGLAIAAIVVGVATLVVYLIFAITIRMH